MTPNYETLLKGSTTWRAEHRDIYITLSHHGYSAGDEYPGARPRPGTWCYYLHLTEEMFRPDDWAKLWMPERICDWGLTHDYENFPDLEFHGGITFYETGEGWSKGEKRKVGSIKVGCDYAHHFDEMEGYWQDHDAVLRDAKHSVDLLLKMFPDHRLRCGYSGIWGEPSEFYEAVNGRHVHRSHTEALKEQGWEKWQPKAPATALSSHT